MAHARLSASKAAQFIACPPSVDAQAGFPNVETKAAREGTAAHAVLEQCVIAGERAVSPEYIGTKAPNGVTITREMARAVDIAIAQWSRDIDGSDWYRLEAKLDDTLKTIDPDLGGSADLIARRGKRLLVRDYKHGAGLMVSPVNNKQALQYALGAAMLPEAVGVETVEIGICQPRTPGSVFETWEISLADLVDFAGTLQEAAALTRAPGIARNAGAHCTFCRAKGVCNAHAKLAMEAAGFDTHAELEHISDTFSLAKLEAPERMSSDELAARLKAAEHLKRWIKSVEDFALAEALNKRPPTGYGLEEGRGSREFTDARAAFKALSGDGDFTEGDFYETSPLSVAQAEGLVGKKVFAEKAGEYVTRKPGKPKLAISGNIKKPFDLNNGFDEMPEFDLAS